MKTLPEALLAELAPLTPLMGARASLDPSRALAPLPVELAARVLEGCRELERARAFTRALAEVVHAIAEDFPDNVFWDLDYLACCLWRAGEPPEMERLARRVVRLCQGFGNKSQLCFRYAHDFLFGFDWARWVMRQPEARSSVGPFDAAFLDYVDGRREELLGLIAHNDAKYGPLEQHTFRNPFTFRREPREEKHLHEELARADLIPVKAWRMDGERRWDLPFSELRTEAARRLGLARGTGP